MKKPDIRRRLRNFTITINFVPQHSAAYWIYIFLFICFLVGSVAWGVVYFDNINILFLGIGGIAIIFTLIILLPYPRSLMDHREKYYTVFTYFYDNRSLVKHVVLYSLAYGFFSLGLPIIIISPPFHGVLVTPGFLFAFQWMCFICIITFFLLVRLPIISTSTLHSKVRLDFFSYRNRKIYHFFRLQPGARKEVIPLYLGGLSVLANSKLLTCFIFGFSFKYHCGIEAYFCVVLYIATTLVVTVPRFRNYFFKTYGSRSLKSLGWNSPQQDAAKFVGTVFVMAGLKIGVGLINEEVSRFNKARDVAFNEQLRREYNQRQDEERNRDPQGFAEGRFPHAPQPPFTTISKDIGESGERVIKGGSSSSNGKSSSWWKN